MSLAPTSTCDSCSLASSHELSSASSPNDEHVRLQVASADTIGTRVFAARSPTLGGYTSLLLLEMGVRPPAIDRPEAFAFSSYSA
jgi:hypothetical protein